MGDPIIRVSELSKRYQLGASLEHDTLRDQLGHFFRSAKSLFTKPAAPQKAGSELWALENVSFDVQQGEVIGIIGRNGAGKSTLLKILSQITEPTCGEIKIRGRLASLLEVGTGFHPELTGRENIYLNGAILGMSKREISARFDDIVAFAEMEKFLDTPVKRYSSGMYTRLAFAVAAHLDPEILVVDEVLAVGDAQFQRKCLSRMERIGGEGRTIFFVSHNVSAITRICNRVIWLHKGKVMQDGPAHTVAAAYLGSGVGSSSLRTWPDGGNPGNSIVRLLQVKVCDEAGELVEATPIHKPVAIEIDYEVLEAGKVLVANFHFFNDEGLCLFISHDVDPEWRHRPKPKGIYRTKVWVPGNFLAEGKVIVGVAVSTYQPFVVHFNERDAVAFTVADDLSGNTARGDYAGHLPGAVRPLLKWETEVL